MARVAEAIAPTEFTSLLALRLPSGLPPTWSHVEALARVRSSQRRRDLAQAMARDALSVRALVQRARLGS
jgi:hypothetical protein